MANPKIYASDLSKQTFTMSLTENAAYPLSNLLTYFEDKFWISSAATDGQTLIVQANAVALNNANKNFVVVGAHNFQAIVDVGGQVQIQYAASSAFTTGLTTVYDSAVDGTEQPLMIDFVSTTRAYWRINFVTLGGVTPQVANFFLGNSFDFGYPYEMPFKPLHYAFQTSEMIALDGRIRTSQAFAARKRWEFEFKGMSDAVRANFDIVMRTIRGKSRPFYILDTDGATAYYVMLEADIIAPTNLYTNWNNMEKLVLRSPLVTT
jgi:hypothetical protein